MNTSEVAFTCGTVLAAGGGTAGVLAVRRGLRSLTWSGYAIRWSLEIKPAPKAKPATAVITPPAREPESRQDGPVLAVVPDGELMTRQQAADFLGVPVTTLKSNEANWHIERSAMPGPRGSVMLTAGSVRRHQAARNGTSAEGT